MKKWQLGSMNDGLFIIDTQPRPSTDEVWHDRPDGPTLVLNVVALTSEQAQAICDAHNADVLAAYDDAIDEVQRMRMGEDGENDLRTLIARIERLKRDAQ